MYKSRHLVENFFCNLNQFRGIATRYDKTDECFAVMIFLAGSLNDCQKVLGDIHQTEHHKPQNPSHDQAKRRCADLNGF